MRPVALVGLLVLLAAAPARAGDRVEVSGHVKAFGVGTIPYDSRLMPPDPTGSAVFDSRVKLMLSPFDGLRFDLHPTLTATVGGATGLDTGVGRGAPEAFPMTAMVVDGASFGLRFRMDRLSARAEIGPVRFTLGRQPISFGQGQAFTPMDLVAPFTPATLDTSYKPGVDALRADVFVGMGGQITVLAAYLGAWTLDGTAIVAHAQATVGAVDLQALVGSIYGDAVVGLSIWAPIGPVGVYGDVTVTGLRPRPFVRAVVGGFARPGPTTTVSVEVYGQRFGVNGKDDYLLFSAGERFQRGELWLSGHLYASVAVIQELTPLLTLNVAVLGNLLDPSFFLLPSVAWNVASNADLSFGVQVGLGKRPDEDADNPFASARSEFGTAPFSGFLNLGVYF